MQYLQPNTTLQGGKYRIERVLGQGGFGITYLATQVSSIRQVAIKELFIGGSGQAINDRRGDQVVVTNSANQQSFNQQKAKFKKEALRLANLNHPNLVKVHEFFEENGTAYYVMDYIEGESLRTKLNREGVLSESLVLKYLQQLLPALETAHKQSIWHLDIKPENIMVDRYGHVYLIDFGASKHIEQNSTLTTSLALAYTRGYCPPELADLTYGSQNDLMQALKEIGPWTDIYALGATMYNLLTDSIPPSSNRLYKEGRNAFSFPSNVSSSTQDLIVWMMKPDKEDRPQNADVVMRILNKKDNTNDECTIIETIEGPAKNTKLERLKKEATAGYADAQNNLGYYYETELGDFEKAVYWYKKAAEQDEQYALNNLGICYERGLGVSQNKEMAFRCYYKAAALGFSHAQCNLALCYEYGNGVSQDYVEAGKWYLKAVDQGYDYASDRLEKLANKIKERPSFWKILLSLFWVSFLSLVIFIFFYFGLLWLLCVRLKIVEEEVLLDNYILNHSQWIFWGLGVLGWAWLSFLAPHYRAKKWKKRVFQE